MKKKDHQALTELLIQWKHTSPEDATWYELF